MEYNYSTQIFATGLLPFFFDCEGEKEINGVMNALVQCIPSDEGRPQRCLLLLQKNAEMLGFKS